MQRVITFTGFSGSGKTTLVVKVIGELTRRGYKVASIKHDAHKFDIDKKGKDSYRHKEAGAEAVIISSRDKFALVHNSKRDRSIAELCTYHPTDADIVIVEGFKKSRYPKIEVFRSEHNTELFSLGDETLTAVAADDETHPALKDAPCVLDINDASQVADFVEKNFIKTPRKKGLVLTSEQGEADLSPEQEKIIISYLEKISEIADINTSFRTTYIKDKD